MFWWRHAAALLNTDQIQQFGLITTKGISQTFNRRLVSAALELGANIEFAIPNHPWVDASGSADVRIAMTVLSKGLTRGLLSHIFSEQTGIDGEVTVEFQRTHGVIGADLHIGVSFKDVDGLQSNDNLSAPGTEPHGKGFIVNQSEAQKLSEDIDGNAQLHIRPYRNGRDISAKCRNVFALDLYGLSEEQVRTEMPNIYQWVFTRVKPVRDQNPRRTRRENWWIFGEPSPQWRRMSNGLERFIATIKTSRHRYFVFLDDSILPDSKLIAFGSNDSIVLGVLSSRFHEVWALRTGARLGVGNDPTYVKTISFEAFPFPDATEPQKSRIRELGEQLDAHRKRQQEKHEKLTMTGMYNVLEKLRQNDTEGGEELSAKEKTIHEQGLVSVLRQIHDELDAAVADAYGWPVDLADEAILERLVALNHERAEEEKRGLVRWLRPDFQNPDGKTQQGMLPQEGTTKSTKKTKAKIEKQPWPKTLSEQAAAVQTALVAIGAPADEVDVAKRFTRASKDRIAELLETLASLGSARQLADGKFLAV